MPTRRRRPRARTCPAERYRLPPPNEAFWALGGLKALTVAGAAGRPGRSLFARADWQEDPDREPLDSSCTMLDPVRLEQLCRADPALQRTLDRAAAAPAGGEDRAMARVEAALQQVFVDQLLVETCSHFATIRATVARALVVRHALDTEESPPCLP